MVRESWQRERGDAFPTYFLPLFTLTVKIDQHVNLLKERGSACFPHLFLILCLVILTGVYTHRVYGVLRCNDTARFPPRGLDTKPIHELHREP